MPLLVLDFANDAYESASTALVNRRLINMYMQVPDGPALNQKALFHSPGLVEFVNMTDDICRGLFETKQRGFGVYGNTFSEVFSNNTRSARGTVNGSRSVRFASNGFVVVIITNLTGYFYDLTTDVLEEITDPTFSSFGTVLDVTYKDGYFVYITEDFIFNGSVVTTNDGRDFDPLSFAAAETQPDGNVACFTLNNQLAILGANTIEWFDTVTGSSGFPFRRIPGATIQRGCVSRNSVVEYQSSMSYLGLAEGESPALFLAVDSRTTKISTPAIEFFIQGLTLEEQQNVICWIYQAGGSPFLALEAGNGSFVYDMRASEKSARHIWHERQTGPILWPTYKNWRARHSMNVFGKILVGDRESNQLGELAYNTYTEYGERIPKGFTTQPFGEGLETHLTQLEMLVEAGVGNDVLENPTLLLEYSDDQGKTWTDPIARELGAEAQYGQRLIWRRLGRFDRNRTLRFYTDDPVKVSLLRLEAVVGDE